MCQSGRNHTDGDRDDTIATDAKWASCLFDGDSDFGPKSRHQIPTPHPCFQLISHLRLWLEFVVLFQHGAQRIQIWRVWGHWFLPRCMECNAVLRWDFWMSVCPSVCLSVKRVHYDKTEEKSVEIFIPCERTFCLVLWEEEWLVGGDPFYLKFWVNRPALERNRRFWTNSRS